MEKHTDVVSNGLPVTGLRMSAPRGNLKSRSVIQITDLSLSPHMNKYVFKQLSHLRQKKKKKASKVC